MTEIARRRKELGQTQVEIARKGNLQPSLLATIERGAYKAGVSIMARVSSALATPALELFDSDGWPLEAHA